MTDNNATQPAEKVGPIRQWIKDHPNIWEFILFNVLSNISTITRFVVTWIGTAIFISGMGAGIAGTIASVVNTLLAVIVSYPLLKFWVMPKSKDSKEATK